MAKHPKTFRKIVLANPRVESDSATLMDFTSMSASTTAYMIQTKEFCLALAATSTFSAIVVEHGQLEFQSPSSGILFYALFILLPISSLVNTGPFLMSLFVLTTVSFQLFFMGRSVARLCLSSLLYVLTWHFKERLA